MEFEENIYCIFFYFRVMSGGKNNFNLLNDRENVVVDLFKKKKKAFIFSKKSSKKGLNKTSNKYHCREVALGQ